MSAADRPIPKLAAGAAKKTWNQWFEPVPGIIKDSRKMSNIEVLQNPKLAIELKSRQR